MSRTRRLRRLCLALLLPAGWGCASILGIDQDYHPLGTGGGNSSSSASSSSGSGGGGGCPMGEAPVGGSCKAVCDGGATLCDGGCPDTTKDPGNCGACGVTCKDGKVCIAGTCGVARCTGALSFGPETAYSAAALPDVLQLADLNGDGKPDIIVPTSTYNLNGGTPEILVLINKGDGSFNEGIPYALSHNATVGVGDINGDGRPEIAVSDSNAKTITLLLNKGDGSFPAQVTLPVAEGPSAVSLGDVNGDGKLDLFWSGAGALSALMNTVDYSYTDTPVTVPFTNSTLMLAADVNSDGKIDVITASTGVPYLRVYLNKGDGTFPSGGSTYYAMADITSISFLDWNGDGKPDILAGGPPDTVLLNSGTGSFETSMALPTLPPYSVVADMNGDGKTDLIGVVPGGSDDTLRVLLNDGNNSFTAQVSAAVVRFTSQVAVADLNGDGLRDMIALSQPSSHVGQVEVVLNTCPR